MPDTRPDIAALIGSRICHDLISPIGAINNGLELLEMAGGTSGPELELISDSVNNASARIRFFRIAFGAASGQPVSVQEVRSVLKDMTAGSKLSLTWVSDTPQPREMVRLALLAEQCLESSMPYGGQITIDIQDGKWHITGQSDRLKIDTNLWGILADGSVPSDLAASHVHFALLALHSRDGGRAVQTTLSEQRIDVLF
ncbi:MAG: histidine phosphotransferase family protein [Aliishimia sp.]